MGLDMMLFGKREFDSIEDDVLMASLHDVMIKNGMPLRSEVYEIKLEMMYWRKAYVIHDWILRHVIKNPFPSFSDERNCVDPSVLVKLRDECAAAISDKSKYDKFFNIEDTDYEFDEKIKLFLEDTAEQVNTILNMPNLERWRFFYDWC